MRVCWDIGSSGVSVLIGLAYKITTGTPRRTPDVLVESSSKGLPKRNNKTK